MTEAARSARAELGPATQLVALYADGSDAAIAGAQKLTLEMIAETAGWLADGVGHPRGPDQVRGGWINHLRRAGAELDAEDFDRRWAAAFAKAQQDAILAERKAELEAAARPKAKPEPLAAPAVITKPALSPLLPGFEKLPEAPKAPAGATELERLTYPPGLLGHATDHAFHCTDTPDRQFALWGAKAGLGKIVDRKLITPKNGSTTAFDLVLAASGAGKEPPMQFALLLLRSAGPAYAKLFQGGMLASVQAIEDLIRLSPNCLVVIDEFGRWFRMIQDQSGNVKELPATLCKLWGQKPTGRYGVIIRANPGAKEREHVELQWPTLSVAGASVGRPFWDACGDDDISRGFLNRCLIFDVGLGALECVEPTTDPDQLEDWFIEAMHKITRAQIPTRAQYR
jgi:hypothetical protein